MKCNTDKTAGGYVLSALVNIPYDVQIVEDGAAAQSCCGLATHSNMLLVVSANSSRMSRRILKQSTRMMKKIAVCHVSHCWLLWLLIKCIHRMDLAISFSIQGKGVQRRKTFY